MDASLPDIFLRILAASWDVLLDSAPWMLLGFFMAGLLKTFVPGDLVNRHLGRSRVSNVLKAALFGVPIPLCSCGVVPAAAGLRKQGASRGATASFLISTPESGVDSIAVTYALLDPIMTVLRPLSAFLTATLAGVLVNATESAEPDGEETAMPPADCSGPACGCTETSCEIPGAAPRPDSLSRRIRSGLRYAFGDLLADIGGWFLFGVLLAGAITALIPDSFVEAHLGEGFVPMLVMLVVAVPMYVCATASTPIAAALALKGLSPGAALVFLLAGPATNVASLSMVAKIIGRRAAAVYLASILIASLLLGLAANLVYSGLGLSVTEWVRADADEQRTLVHLASAVVLLGLIVWSRLPRRRV